MEVERLTKLRERLKDVDAKLQDAPPPPVNVDLTDPDRPPSYVDSLRRYDVALRRLITLEETRARSKVELDSVIEEIDQVATQGLDAPRPYSVKLLDDLQGQHDSVTEKLRSAELSYTAAKTTKELEAERLASLEALRRRLLDKQTDKSNDVALRRRIENTETAVQASQASKELAETEMQTSQLEKDIATKRLELLKLKLGIVQESFRFSSETLENQLQELETARTELTQKLQEYQQAETVSLERLTELRNDDIDDEEQEIEIAAREEWVRTHQRKERLLEERLEFNVLRRDLWERRYLAHSGEAVNNYADWADATRGLLVRLKKNRDVLTSELSQLRTKLSEILERKEIAPEAAQEWFDIQAQALINRQKSLEETLTYQVDTESLAKRLLAEFNQRDSKTTFSERVSKVWSSLRAFWNIELYTLGDSAVTVGKLSIAITILVVGLALVGRVTNFLSRRFIAVLPIRESVRANLERVFRYLFTLLLILFSLHVVNIPLTIFTFLGGTLAIAVGFGAQNILNNFISGLILMVERPVRAGDLIQVDDTIGHVEEIGARSTRVRIPNGIHVILPNSSLLENKVINWTLQDNRIRAKVCVGVAYGSPTREVVEMISEACTREDRVLNAPPPTVTFDDFGDSSLNFTVHFWVSVRNVMERDLISTAVRHNINEIFAANNIEIPFPQRDLNFSGPLPVQVLSQEEGEA